MRYKTHVFHVYKFAKHYYKTGAQQGAQEPCQGPELGTMVIFEFFQ